MLGKSRGFAKCTMLVGLFSAIGSNLHAFGGWVIVGGLQRPSSQPSCARRVANASGARAPLKADHCGSASVAVRWHLQFLGWPSWGQDPVHRTFRSRPTLSKPAVSGAKFRRKVRGEAPKDSKFWNTGMRHMPTLGRNKKKLERFGNARRFAARDPSMLRPRASMSGMKAFEAPANPAMLCLRKLYRRDQEIRWSRVTWRC
jgi:hypothetical protein